MEVNKIYNMDCIKGMKQIPNKSINMILCDLPYGITQCKWDSVIPLDELWEQYKRILKENGVVVLTASQPFTSALVMSNLKMFKHEWIWKKEAGSNFANTVREPMKEHESIIVFGCGGWTYNKQLQERVGSRKGKITKSVANIDSKCYREGLAFGEWEKGVWHETWDFKPNLSKNVTTELIESIGSILSILTESEYGHCTPYVIQIDDKGYCHLLSACVNDKPSVMDMIIRTGKLEWVKVTA